MNRRLQRNEETRFDHSRRRNRRLPRRFNQPSLQTH
jgi:hypothetical protein